MITIKPLYLALAGSFVLSIPSQTVQAATLFSGVGDDAIAAFAAMETAIGGSDNTSLEPQPDGFRRINWDGVLLDGTDFEGNTEVIVPDQVIAIPEERFLSLGNNTIFNLDLATLETTSGSVDDPENGVDLVAADDFVYAEPMYIAAEEEEVEIPEPSLLAGLLLVGLLPKRCRKKQ